MQFPHVYWHAAFTSLFLHSSILFWGFKPIHAQYCVFPPLFLKVKSALSSQQTPQADGHASTTISLIHNFESRFESTPFFTIHVQSFLFFPFTRKSVSTSHVIVGASAVGDGVGRLAVGASVVGATVFGLAVGIEVVGEVVGVTVVVVGTVDTVGATVGEIEN